MRADPEDTIEIVLPVYNESAILNSALERLKAIAGPFKNILIVTLFEFGISAERLQRLYPDLR